MRVVETGKSPRLAARTEVLRRDGTSLCATNQTELDCQLGGDRPYAIIVRDLYGTNAGTYELTLNKL